MNDCTCIIYHPTDQDYRGRLAESLKSASKSDRLLATAMLGPCETRGE